MDSPVSARVSSECPNSFQNITDLTYYVMQSYPFSGVRAHSNSRNIYIFCTVPNIFYLHDADLLLLEPREPPLAFHGFHGISGKKTREIWLLQALGISFPRNPHSFLACARRGSACRNPILSWGHGGGRGFAGG